MPLRSLVVDFNSYFASVEQELQPGLRGKPVAVVPVMAETTCCIAASYEAKKFKVKTGTRVSDARRMCPGLVVVGRGPRPMSNIITGSWRRWNRASMSRKSGRSTKWSAN